MPESNQTLTDQVENEQAQTESDLGQAENDQAQPENQPAQPQSDEAQMADEQAQPENEQSKKTAVSQRDKEVLRSISPPSGRTKRRHYSEDDVLLRFTSCGRCGLFLTTYRLSYDQEFLEAIEEIEADWLILPWHSDMRELVNKSYGSPVDIESYYLEGTCPECRRSYSFAEPDPDQPAWFLVKL